MRLDPPAKPDFLVFMAETAIPRVLPATLDPRAPSAPSEHKVLLEQLDNKVPPVPQEVLVPRETPAQPDNKVLWAT